VHELSIATSIYESCRAILGRHGGGRLASVRVAVGELSAVEPELLRYAWEALLSASPDRGCPLEVEWRPARQWCAACAEDTQRAPGSWLRVCPRCGEPLSLEGGDELEVMQLSYTPPGSEEGEGT
jgi:hydrogenase nickel incorporation protein HypA/HybF